MAGDPRLADLVSFLGRLTGDAVTANTPVKLRSVQRAALAAWCNRQTPPVHVTGLVAGTAQTPASMLAGLNAASPAERHQAAVTATPVGDLDGGLGIDMEDVLAMPLADDYRAHPFYRDNFTEAELSHAIRQRDVRASLCGLWAAKEAIVKSGLVQPDASGLKTIEIGWTGTGGPHFPGALLSISHTDRSAVAVCVVARHRAADIPRPTAITDAPRATGTKWPRGPRFAVVTAAAVGVLACAAWGTWL